MKYRISDYVISFEEGKDIILWSTMHAKGFVIQRNEFITKLLNKEEFCLNELKKNSVLWELYNNKVILSKSEQENEYKIVDYRYNNTVYNRTHMAITIIPTDACNFKCIYCYQPNVQKNYMTIETADKIIKMIEKCKQLRSLNVSLFGGEPLCNKKVVFYLMEKLNKICTEKSIHLIAQITTNASLLDKETFEKLISLKVLLYQITIDGSRITHNIQRPFYNGQPSYDIILSNIKDIKSVKSNVFKIGIRSNCSELFTDKDMDDFFEDLNNIIKNDKRFYYFFQWVKNWGGERIKGMAPNLLSDNLAIDKYGKWMFNSIEKGINTANYMQIKPMCIMCSASAYYSFIINYDGKLHKCDSGMYGKLADINEIGYISDNGNLYIDDTKNAMWIEREYDKEKCIYCPQYPLCCGALCPNIRLSKKTVKCDLEHKFIKVIMRSFYKQGLLNKIGDNNV